jgi:thiamine pyrophosphate-dependent acetolactate synthase large subunit-like protein
VEKHGTHANRDLSNGIFVSGGSLGQPEPVALGMALANRKRDVYLVTSDGALAEGSVWETLRIAADQDCRNFIVHVVANGFGAYSTIDLDALESRLNAFFPTIMHRVSLDQYPTWMSGLDAHYLRLSELQYTQLISDETKSVAALGKGDLPS